MPPDTPTLLANASAGQLLDDAKVASALATQCVIGMREEEREPLLRLAELARAVAALEERHDRLRETARATGPTRWHVTAYGSLDVFACKPHSRDVPQSLCAALASTRHTQGEG